MLLINLPLRQFISIILNEKKINSDNFIKFDVCGYNNTYIDPPAAETISTSPVDI